jgi:hypothetical protein
MTLLEELTAHKGGLLLLKTELWWYGGRGWDGIRGRVCLLMDARDAAGTADDVLAAATYAAAVRELRPATAAFLLVDGEPHWVWVAQADVELL